MMTRKTYNTNSQIKFKTLMLKSRLCNYSDVYKTLKETILVANREGAGAAANNYNKEKVN